MLYTVSMSYPIVQTDLPPDFIDLGCGNPSLDLLPLAMLERASARYFSDGDRRTLQYGAERGNGYFLAALAEFLSAKLDFPVPSDGLLVTNGASAALDLLCTIYTKPGQTIFVEEPTYFLARRIFADHQLQLEAVPVDQDGLIIAALEEKLARKKPQFLYTIPTFHNPASVTLSLERRERLVNLADQHNFWVIADEVYHFLGYDLAPPQPLAAFSSQCEQVISVNSFSKILAPGLRLGWIQAHPEVISQLASIGLLDSGGGLNPYTSAVVLHLIQAGDLEKNIVKLKGVYQARLGAMQQALAHYLPEAEFIKPQGGFFYWVRLLGWDLGKLRPSARQAKVDFRPGELFSSQAGLKEYLRLSFSYYEAPQIKRGVEKLAEILHQAN